MGFLVAKNAVWLEVSGSVYRKPFCLCGVVPVFVVRAKNTHFSVGSKRLPTIFYKKTINKMNSKYFNITSVQSQAPFWLVVIPEWKICLISTFDWKNKILPLYLSLFTKWFVYPVYSTYVEVSLVIRAYDSQSLVQLTFLIQKLAAYCLQTLHPLVLVLSLYWSYTDVYCLGVSCNLRISIVEAIYSMGNSQLWSQMRKLPTGLRNSAQRSNSIVKFRIKFWIWLSEKPITLLKWFFWL